MLKNILILLSITIIMANAIACDNNEHNYYLLSFSNGKDTAILENEIYEIPIEKSKHIKYYDSIDNVYYLPGQSLKMTTNKYIQIIDNNQFYIAHGGGTIGGMKSPNCKEAVDNAIKDGIKFIELDFLLTSDNYLVCCHDWKTYHQRTKESNKDNPVSYSEFKKAKYNNQYTPLTYEMVDSIWSANPNIILVTDKISDPQILEKFLPTLKNRMVVESFSQEDYNNVNNNGYYLAMYSGYDTTSRYTYQVIGSERYESLNYYDKINPNVFYAMWNVKIDINKNYANFWFDYDKNIKFFYIDQTN